MLMKALWTFMTSVFVVLLFWDTMVVPEDLNTVVAGLKTKKAE